MESCACERTLDSIPVAFSTANRHRPGSRPGQALARQCFSRHCPQARGANAVLRGIVWDRPADRLRRAPAIAAQAARKRAAATGADQAARLGDRANSPGPSPAIMARPHRARLMQHGRRTVFPQLALIARRHCGEKPEAGERLDRAHADPEIRQIIERPPFVPLRPVVDVRHEEGVHRNGRRRSRTI